MAHKVVIRDGLITVTQTVRVGCFLALSQAIVREVREDSIILESISELDKGLYTVRKEVPALCNAEVILTKCCLFLWDINKDTYGNRVMDKSAIPDFRFSKAGEIIISEQVYEKDFLQHLNELSKSEVVLVEDIIQMLGIKGTAGRYWLDISMEQSNTF